VIPTAIKTALDAFQNETAIYVKYLPDGAAGWSGQCVVTNMSLSGGLDAVNKFAVTLQGSGTRTTI
jgi:predicted secreted protein